MSRIAVIRTSPHKNGNTNLLVDKFIEGTKESGNEVVDVNLNNYRLNYCMGCYGTDNPSACTVTGKCWQADDANTICDIIRECDALVFATPIYFYSVSGQMKVLLDRSLQLYGASYKFKDIYLITCCEAKKDTAIDGAIKTLEGWIACMPGTRIAGTLCGTGVLAPGSISEQNGILKKAVELGKQA